MQKTKMNPEIKKKWVEALRSGTYKQTESVLWNGSRGFCCLGVLCDIRRKEGKDNRKTFFEEISIETDGEELLPKSVAVWADLEEVPVYSQATYRDISVEYKGVQTNLSILNDNRRSFIEIADIIEEQL